MADTVTTAYSLTKPEIGASEDTWGEKINTDLDTLDTVVNAIGGKTAAGTLSYANSAKLATTATGIDVTGTVTADGLTLDSGVYKINNTSTGSGSDKWVGSDGGAGVFVNAGASGNFNVYNNNNAGRLNVNGSTGDISFYEDTGTTPKFFWDASAERLGLGTTTPATSIQVVESGGTPEIRLADGTHAAGLGVDTVPFVGAISNTSFAIKTNNTERMRIDSSGNVGIGLSSSLSGLSINSSIRSQNSASNISYMGFTSYTGTTAVGAMYSYMGGDGRSTGYLNFSTNDTERMRIDSSGYITSTASNPQISFVDSANSSYKWSIQNTSSAIRFYDNTATSERMRIDSSGNVGIGTSSPAAAFSTGKSLDVNGPVFVRGVINAHQTNAGVLEYSADETRIRSYGATSGSGKIIFSNGGGGSADTERMRIDSSGNLLVGKTSSSSAVAGFMVEPEGDTYITAEGVEGRALYLNRLSSDGTILQFAKDGTTVGSIQSVSGVVSNIVLDPRAGVKGSGLRGASIDASEGLLLPVDNAGNIANGTITLGQPSSQFKDLYLSGGVYLGGTGAANKLDDYEEGTWTPVVGGVSQSANGAWYTKIGRFIMLSADFTISGAPSTNYTDISGLPFSAGVNYSGIVTFGYNTDNSATMSGLVNNTGSISLYAGGTNRPDLNNGDRVIFAAYYQTA